jgi:hypothetical protein
MPISVIEAIIENAAKDKAPKDIQTYLNELLQYLNSVFVLFDMPV